MAVDADRLLSFTQAAFRAMGLDEEQAAITAGALVYSELRFHPGQGQGVRRLRAYRERIGGSVIDPRARFEIVKESPALALVDAHNGLGSVTGVRAMRLAVTKAKTCGIGTVVVRGSTHYGSSAVHAHEAVHAGCIGIAFTNAGPEMAPWGGATPMVGTNPWAIGAPGGHGFPVILDIALTTAGKGMMRWHARENRPMPLDWALTPDGEETDDPVAAMQGALLGIGQYKGYGLSLMTDVMTGVVSGGAFGRTPYSDPLRQDVAHTFTAIDVEWFMPLATFQERMARLVDDIRTSRLRPGFSEVLVPGELEHRRETQKRRDGVPLDKAVYDDLKALAGELGIPFAIEVGA
ncbi:Ldh family oxidoreductase [uncultured Alsobacter sp.]|uniref:Ldh family oxidoreductase n=1 Tax=uncultured Alsobacter sp. TaxID=1748258 RepID=UPI0025DB1605|nr:Ldh family oxidoreductase [uncultured Alsobacter sp.]